MSPSDRPAAGPRDVITAFLWDGERILLALRSESVSTFPGHWAAISGYLEGHSPVEWGLVEIAEECGVSRGHLTLLRTGPPMDVKDEQSQLAFRVHPMLFFLDDPSRVRRDWEAARFEWVDLADIQQRKKIPTVPKLYEAFESVWPPWPAEQAIQANCDSAVGLLRNDRQLGAYQLARVAAAELFKLVHLAGGDDFQQYKPALATAVARLQAARRSMAAPANLLEDLGSELDGSPDAEVFLAAGQRRLAAAEQAEKTVAENAAALLHDRPRVMTISYSGTVLHALQSAADALQRVYVCEGRPLMEGRQLAQDLYGSGVMVTLLTDAQAFAVMPQVDCVLIGADAILHNHDAVNKAGSAMLALAARHFDKPFYVAADSLKWERRPEDVVFAEANAGDEVWSGAPDGLRISNRYFDRIPRELITLLISESGEIAPHL